jgi:hypothetical protein
LAIFRLVVDSDLEIKLNCLTRIHYASLLLATVLFKNTALAGLGWTLEECKENYGEPTDKQTHALGIEEYEFSAEGFYIDLEMDQKGKVGYIAYTKSSIADELAVQLMKQNAPKASWEIEPDSSPNRKGWWGSENGSRVYLALLIKSIPIPTGTTGDVLAIGTFEFDRLYRASKKQEAKDQVSGP